MRNPTTRAAEGRSPRRTALPPFVLLCAVLTAGCGQNSIFPPNPTVKVQNLTVKVHWPSASAALETVTQQQQEFQVSPDQLLKLVTEDKTPQAGMGPGDRPVLVAINKQLNDAKHWRLTDNVKAVRLKKETSGVELKVIGQSPLRVELWTDSPREIELAVEMKE